MLEGRAIRALWSASTAVHNIVTIHTATMQLPRLTTCTSFRVIIFLTAVAIHTVAPRCSSPVCQRCFILHVPYTGRPPKRLVDPPTHLSHARLTHKARGASIQSRFDSSPWKQTVSDYPSNPSAAQHLFKKMAGQPALWVRA